MPVIACCEGVSAGGSVVFAGRVGCAVLYVVSADCVRHRNNVQK